MKTNSYPHFRVWLLSRVAVFLMTASTLHAGPVRHSSAAWRQDLHYLVGEMHRLHPHLFFAVTQEDFEQTVAELDRAIPELSDDEILAGLFRVVAFPTLLGHDGHSGMFSFDPSLDAFLPLQLYIFSDGIYVVDATSAYQDLIGARLLAMDGSDMETIAEAVDPLITRDGPPNLRYKLPAFFVSTQLLHGVGVIENPRQVELELKRPGESSFPMAVTAVTSPEFGVFANPRLTLPTSAEVLYLSQPTMGFWSKLLLDSRTLFVQYNSVSEKTQSGESLQDFSRRLLSTARSGSVDRVVIDLRHNVGGDNTTFGPLIDAMRDPSINRSDRLFVIIGRQTFSAAGNFVTEVEKKTNAVLVGEATGGAPNQFGDAEQFRLPRTRYLAAVSTVYHQRSTLTDPRQTHQPHVEALLSSEDYFAGRDVALETILGLSAPAARR